MAPSESQQYISTRGGSSGLSFEDVVLKGLADDGGLFVPQAIPSLPDNWKSWKDLSFEQLAVEVMSLYISRDEIDRDSLKEISKKTYSTFRHSDVTPLVPLDKEKNLYLLELFHGPTFAFKDVALQFLGNLFEFFLVRRNGKLEDGEKRHHLTIVGATSGDTGSAAIYGLRNKRDVSVFILFPTGRVSPIQEAQMTTVLDKNVHCLSLDGTFDDCQDTVKALFADSEIRKTQHLGAVNSINWARILAQITYYFYGYFSLLKQQNLSPEDKPQISFAVPTGNFGDILAGFFAKRMGLPIAKLIVSTNENDILYRFFQSGKYEKREAPAKSSTSHGGIKADGAEAHEEGVKETLSPAMDILVSSNFERLVWMLHYEGASGTSIASSSLSSSDEVQSARKEASAQNAQLFNSLKSTGSFAVNPSFLAAAKTDFSAERISDTDTINTIKSVYTATSSSSGKGYILDPHSAIGVDAAYRAIKTEGEQSKSYHISLSTAHPAKFANAVDLALKDTQGYSFKDVFPPEFEGLETAERKVINVSKSSGLAGVRNVILEEVKKEGVQL